MGRLDGTDGRRAAAAREAAEKAAEKAGRTKEEPIVLSDSDNEPPPADAMRGAPMERGRSLADAAHAVWACIGVCDGAA